MQERAVTLEHVEILVLDEADRMLDMGFIHDIRRIVGKCPAQRQTLFFSATMPPPIEELGRIMLRDPARVAVTPPASTVERIAQRVVHIDKAGKANLLADLLKSEPIDRAIVFTRTKHGADRVVRQLSQAGLAAEAIHGNKSQGQRERALAAFRNGKVKTLIATDIAARGIDVDGITHVFNYDLPNVAESYVHRIGRTARAGADGIAISFCDNEERAYLRDIERLIRMALPATDGRTGQAVEARAPSPARAPGQPAKSRSRNRPGQRGRRRDQEAKGDPAGQNGRQQEQRTHAQPFTAPQRQNGGTDDAALSSVGFMRDRKPERRAKRPHAQSPR
jgi:ATP-dependent RNA helicase RhlE